VSVTTNNYSTHRIRGKVLGVPELIAIALGGMIGGGIFSILGIAFLWLVSTHRWQSASVVHCHAGGLFIHQTGRLL